MQYQTWSEIKTQVQRELGIEQEEFISDTELLGYANEAIDEAEAEIHTIYEDYFLTSAYIAMATGTKQYALPTNMYGLKIRAVIYENGNIIYPVDRMRFNDKFLDIALTEDAGTDMAYRYQIINDAATANPMMELYPPARETLAQGLRVWYIRNANRLSALTDNCDIPEFASFVRQFMKVRIYEKESHPNLAGAANFLNQQRRQMVSTLTNMIPDGDTEIEKDWTFYHDMV